MKNHSDQGDRGEIHREIREIREQRVVERGAVVAFHEVRAATAGVKQEGQRDTLARPKRGRVAAVLRSHVSIGMDRSRAWRCAVHGTAIALLASGVAGCGGNDVTGPSPGDGPVNQTITGLVATFGTTRHPLMISRSGSLTLRLSWSTGTVDLDLVLAPSTCVELYPTSACGVLAASDSATGTSEEIRRTVSAGESFSIFVDNLSPTQSQSYTITIAIP